MGSNPTIPAAIPLPYIEILFQMGKSLSSPYVLVPSEETMTTSEPLVNSLLNRLTDGRARLRILDAERDQLLKDVAALEHVVQLYTGASTESPQRNSSEFASMTLGQALIQIARENNGVLTVVPAKRRLLQCGMLTNPKNAGSRLYSHLARDPHFEHTDAGQFKLVEEDTDQMSQNGLYSLDNA